MPERHLTEYELFYQEQPFGLWREDYRTAQISHLLAMINRDPKGDSPKLSDFMPFHQKAEETEDDDGGVAAYLASR
ncbi:DUF4035 domain-containing protein [Glaesserella parasuis]|uniref:DUF4035 domain-containing protein n=1 Tax=Glaesserella parasuis TaxID=738 RepID=A0A6M8T188_GLAPU|nr:DUF4035 domain-containing protein [Glaesserella parasuis]MDD2167371.1 DUF4035 domain-containing protein [Glaesserella parasuis]MDG6772299.1 DUF4035 domain-containing protein [Glaesserella parasuis]MDO9872618.1 DUF4035 domain-containing protein [Glaesserella parasuis]MDO9914198.1 DUF4035 domain-containing protein [Glaesserella parasuis]MDP0310205.1 DUF4035 domain-containing protein [Glaesserella parasuis]